MKLREKLLHLWEYEKLTLFGAAVLAFVLLSILHHRAASTEHYLYLGAVNVTTGEELTAHLTADFMRTLGDDAAGKDILYYQGLYLTTDTESEFFAYSYASRIKILASIDEQKLDLVLMNREAFDAFAQNGYLYDLDTFAAKTEAFPEDIRACLVTNTQILEDNAQELVLGEEETYRASTRSAPMAVDVSGFPCIKAAGFPETVYLGILANTPREAEAAAYLKYLSLAFPA